MGGHVPSSAIWLKCCVLIVQSTLFTGGNNFAGSTTWCIILDEKSCIIYSLVHSSDTLLLSVFRAMASGHTGHRAGCGYLPVMVIIWPPSWYVTKGLRGSESFEVLRFRVKIGVVDPRIWILLWS